MTEHLLLNYYGFLIKHYLYTKAPISLNNSSPPLHICFVIHEYSASIDNAQEFLDFTFSLTEWAEALTSKGLKISAYIRFTEDKKIVQNGISYFFIKDDFARRLRPWQIPKQFHRTVSNANPDIVHAHNMNKPIQHWHLARLLKKKNIPILIQNHAETPNHKLRNFIQKHLFYSIDAFLFCAEGQEITWLDREIIPKEKSIFFVMEGSTHFQFKPRIEARNKTKLQGQPIFLWVGNLNNRKDPKTILSAFERISQINPNARLYMAYQTGPLTKSIAKQIKQSSILSKSVTLLGIIKRVEIEWYYNSADYFILGSHSEGSGYSAMEAMACGCIPILSDIPSYRMMTKQGAVGGLFSVGDISALIEVIQSVLSKPIQIESQKARQTFEESLSYDAIAENMLLYYKKLLKKG